MTAKKKIKEYIDRSMRKLKHRKGYGVHSPFAFDIITEVIEEKLPYYNYQRMQRSYPQQAPMAFKVACLIYRLANRFHVRKSLEIGCDGGYTVLPLLLVDSANQVTSVATEGDEMHVRDRMSWTAKHMEQLHFVRTLEEYAEQPDLIIMNSMPAGMTAETLNEWIEKNTHENTVILVHGIKERQPLEQLWDTMCDNENIAITMDLYDYGLAIKRPRFFKQHYIVSF